MVGCTHVYYTHFVLSQSPIMRNYTFLIKIGGIGQKQRSRGVVPLLLPSMEYLDSGITPAFPRYIIAYVFIA